MSFLHKKPIGKLRCKLALALMAGLISACGGGGGSSSATTSSGSGGNSTAPVTGVQMPGSVAVVTAQNAG